MTERPEPLPARYAEPVWLGEGASGVVWRVTDRDWGLPVALKVVRSTLAVHERFRARFAREVALAASVVHPHVVPVRDSGRLSDGRPYVAMDLAAHGSLADRLHAGVAPEQAVRLMADVLSALACLHGRGLVHQDLKPENVLLHGDLLHPSAWVADLGVAGARTELALARRGIAGTRAWMAPEQVEGRAQELGPWTDLYAIGLILHTLLGGPELPLLRTGAGLSRPAPALPGTVPPELARVVEILLDMDPRQRFDRACDARRALLAASPGLSAAPRAPVDRLQGSTTTFPDTLLPEARDPVSIPRRFAPPTAEVPRWHRVSPGPLPVEPPMEPAWAIPGHAPRLMALRDPPDARQGLRRALWGLAGEVVARQAPQVVLLIGGAATGKALLAAGTARDLDEGGWMEAVTLRYAAPPGEDDGYRGGVQELLAPWNDTRVEAEARLARWLARDQQTLAVAVATEARALARWCGYSRPDDPPVNAALGLAYLYRHLDARAWRGGAVLVLENVHNAMQSGDGLDICRALLSGSVGERPVLALATLDRSAVEDDPALAARVQALEALGAVRVDVGRLGEDEMGGWLQTGLCLDPALAAELAPRCLGSPVFATLLLRDWGVRGLLRWGDHARLCLREGLDPDVLVPSTLQQLAGRRLDGALATVEAGLRSAEALTATALGGPAPPALVLREVDLEGLDGLLSTGVVRQQGFRLVFEHPALLEEALRRGEAQADRPRVHAALAAAWQKLGEVTGADVDLVLGAHLVAAGEPARALAPLLRASRSALLGGRPGIAREAAVLALDAAAAVGRPMARIEARQRLAEALLELDRPAEADRLLADELPMDPRSRARDALLRARAAIASGRAADGSRLLTEAATAFEATRDWPGLVETAHGQATLYRLQGRPDKAAERYDRMRKLNRGLDHRAEVLALAGGIEARVAAGRLEGLDAEATRLRRLAQDGGDTRNLAQANYVSGLVALRVRRLDPAERHFRTALALAAIQGDDRLELACENALGEVLRYSGDAAGARSRYARAADVAERNGWRAVAAVSRLNLSLLALSPDPAGAKAQVDRAEALLSDQGTHWAWLFVGVLRALWAAEAGDPDACGRWLDRAEGAGLGRLASPDVWLPLERLGTEAARRGWRDLARRASRGALAGLPAAGADLDLDPEPEGPLPADAR